MTIVQTSYDTFYAALGRFHPGFTRLLGAKEECTLHQYYTPMSGMHLAVLFALDEAINLLLKNGCPIKEHEGADITLLLIAID